MVALLKRVIRLFHKDSIFDDVFAPLLEEYGVDPNKVKSSSSPEDFLAAVQDVIDRATQDGTARGKEVAAQLFYHLGKLYFLDGNMEGVVVAWRQAVELGKESSAPRALELAAVAAFALCDKTAIPEEEAEKLCYDAMELGEKSDTPLGLGAAAGGALGAGLYLQNRYDKPRARWAWSRAVELGRRSGTQAGLETAAKAAVNLGIELELESHRLRSGRAKLDAEQAYRQAIELGMKSTTREGRGWAQVATRHLEEVAAGW